MFKKNKISNWLITLPNKLTLGRILVIPIIVILYPLNVTFLNIFCACLFLLAALTDFFDGYLARRFHTESRLGATLDPIADKILITAMVVLLTNSGNPPLPAFIAALILCREVAISGLRLTAHKEDINIEVNHFGKLKTVTQDVAIFCLLTNLPKLHTFGMVAIWISLGFSYFSAYQYWLLFWKKQKDQFK